jgi:hypothetical protein
MSDIKLLIAAAAAAMRAMNGLWNRMKNQQMMMTKTSHYLP